MNYIEKVQSYSPIAYWPLNEPSGNYALDYSGNGYTGTYTGVTLGQAGIGDGETCPLFDSVNDFVNAYSAGFAAAFDGQEGTINIWAKVFNAAVWEDGVDRFMVKFEATATNNVLLHKRNTNNRVSAQYLGANHIRHIDGLSDIDWHSYAITWSLTAGIDGEFKVYLDGVQRGSTEATLGTWAGALHSARCVLGAYDTGGSNSYYGWLAHPAVWDNALSPTQIADLAVSAVGDTYWGHITGVVENPRTFVNNWTGSSTIVGSGDGEQVCISAGENMFSEIVDTGLYTVTLVQNIYDGTGDDVTLAYRHSGTVAGCQVASWVPYSTPFTSLGYVQVRTTPS